MSVKISVLKESHPGERRVATVPSVIARLVKLGCTVRLQTGAGVAATFPDTAFQGVEWEADPARLVGDADIVMAVNAPPLAIIAAMKSGAVLVSFVQQGSDGEIMQALRDKRISSFAMERVPRISRAQAMDALTSQAALAGYYAPLLGAVHMPRILPMMTTAVGSLRAAKVLVMGLGVAGLQALATAHRLGAITEGYDVRPETKEQAQSLGAKFVDTGVDARGVGGYARELTADEKQRVNEAIGQHIAAADMIVTTASVPGRKAPRLISAGQIAAMKPGSVIVDLAAEGGGNCEGTRPGETVLVGPATILGPLNVPSMLAEHASELYAKNLLNLVQLIVHDGTLAIDLTDEVIAGTLLTHDGQLSGGKGAPSDPHPAAAAPGTPS